MPEVSEQDLRVLRGSAALLDDLWNDATHGDAIKRAVKAKRPDVSIPEIDVPDRVLAPVTARLSEFEGTLAKVNERLAALDERDSNAALDVKFRAALGDARSKFKLTEDGEKGVLELMRERQIADPEAAAALYMANLPKTKPASLRDGSAYGAGQYANLFDMRGGGDERAKLLATDPDGFFVDEATRILNEYADQA